MSQPALITAMRDLWLAAGAALVALAVYAAEQQAPPPVSVHFSLAEKPSLRIDCSAPLACTRFPAPAASYAYAPADIDYQGVDHLFFCSAGDPSAGFDEIRYINDRDKKMAIVLSVPGYRDAGGRDMAACDPALVLFTGYFYLFYGSSLTLNPENPDKTKWQFINVIHVARSASIGGPYNILDQDGTWKPATDNPRHIIPPQIVSVEKSQPRGYLGASWPSVVVRGEKLLMWFMDDTGMDRTKDATGRPYYLLETTDPAQWNMAAAVKTDLAETVHSGDVKLDPNTNEYVMFSVHGAHTATAWLGTHSSADGVHWSAAEKVADLPPYSHNLGVESDAQGRLPSGAVTVSFAAPVGLKNDISWGHWSLYAGKLTRR